MILTGQLPIAFRQTCTAAFAGVAPEFSSKAYVPVINNGIIEYADPDDTTKTDLDQGGIFDFEQNVRLQEIRCDTAAGDIVVTIGDRDNTDHDVEVYNGTGVHIIDVRALIVLASQVVKIESDSAGWIDVYVVKGEYI